MSSLPSDLEPNVGIAAIRQHVDKQGYICYRKKRGINFGAMLKTELDGAANIILTPEETITLVTVLSTATFTQITLPGTADLLRYVMQIGYLEPETAQEEWWFDLIFENEGANPISVVGGDGSTSFLYSGSAGSASLAQGVTILRVRAVTLGLAPTIQIFPVPVAGSATIPFGNLPLYSPFPTQDVDSLILFDASDGNRPKTLTRAQFFAQNSNITNVVIGPGNTQNFTGTNNVIAGNGAAGLSPATASDIIALGANAARVSSGPIVAIGTNALQSSTGVGNTAVGYLAASSMTTSRNNTALGQSALATLQTGGALDGQNVAIGFEAMQNSNVAASWHTAVGYRALRAAGAGIVGNTAVGNECLQSCTGISSTAVGYWAGRATTTGVTNAFGDRCLAAATGTDNCGFGFLSGTSVNTGIANSFFGNRSGQLNTTGSNNSFFGNQSGQSVTTGTLLVAMGNTAMQTGWTTQTNSVCIGNAAGNGSATSNAIFFQSAVASVAAGADAVSFALATGRLHVTASSKVYKTEINDLSISTDVIDKLRPREFTYGTPEIDENGKWVYIDQVKGDIGLVADEVFEVEPRLASRGKIEIHNRKTKKSEVVAKDAPRNYYDRRLVTLMLKAIQELRQTVRNQQEDIDRLANRIENLE